MEASHTYALYTCSSTRSFKAAKFLRATATKPVILRHKVDKSLYVPVVPLLKTGTQ